jgi:hypothetical protein
LSLSTRLPLCDWVGSLLRFGAGDFCGSALSCPDGAFC